MRDFFSFLKDFLNEGLLMKDIFEDVKICKNQKSLKVKIE